MYMTQNWDFLRAPQLHEITAQAQCLIWKYVLFWLGLTTIHIFSVCDIDTLVFLLKFRQEYLDTLYRYAKFQYECGNYSGAAEYLYFFRVLVSFQRLPLTFNTS